MPQRRRLTALRARAACWIAGAERLSETQLAVGAGGVLRRGRLRRWRLPVALEARPAQAAARIGLHAVLVVRGVAVVQARARRCAGRLGGNEVRQVVPCQRTIGGAGAAGILACICRLNRSRTETSAFAVLHDCRDSLHFTAARLQAQQKRFRVTHQRKWQAAVGCRGPLPFGLTTLPASTP